MKKQFGFRTINHVLISTTEHIKSQLEQGNYVAAWADPPFFRRGGRNFFSTHVV